MPTTKQFLLMLTIFVFTSLIGLIWKPNTPIRAQTQTEFVLNDPCPVAVGENVSFFVPELGSAGPFTYTWTIVRPDLTFAQTTNTNRLNIVFDTPGEHRVRVTVNFTGTVQADQTTFIVRANPTDPRVVETLPSSNGDVIGFRGLIGTTVDCDLASNTLAEDGFVVRGQQTGVYSGAIPSFQDNGFLFISDDPFKAGERIVSTLSRDVAAGDVPIGGYSWQFRADVVASSGLFASTGQVLGSADSTDVALGDVDGDGDIDAFVTNGTQPFAVWQHTRNGRFTELPQSVALRQAYAVALGDLDGDGDLDAFLARDNDASGQLNAVLLNEGNGLFRDTQQTFDGADLARKSRGVALGDFDSDGDLDALVANQENQPNVVWFNNGTGLFEQGSYLTASLRSSLDVTVGDLNNDGHLDAFVANHAGQVNEFWFNDGAGNFNLMLPDDAMTGSNTVKADVGDFDDDGNLDVGVANFGLPHAIWRNNGDSTFGRNPFGANSNQGTAFTFADVNGDNRLDVVLGYNNAPTEIWLNQTGSSGDGAGLVDGGQRLGQGNTRAIGVGDLDGDKDLDLFLTNNGGNTVWLNQNRGSGVFVTTPNRVGLGNTRRVELADVDRDGDLDAFIVSRQPPAMGRQGNDPSTELWLNEGTGTFTVSEQTFTSESSTVALGDLNGDGASEAVLGSESDTPNEIWLNDGTGVFTISENSLGSSEANAVALGDLNGDGATDVAIGTDAGQTNEVWLNDGTGSFSQTDETLGEAEATVILLVDLNQDGLLDGVIGSTAGITNEIWINNDGNLMLGTQTLGTSASNDIAVGDVDGDGIPDIIIGTPGEAVNEIWLNSGTGVFSPTQPRLGSDEANSIDLADLDNDGDLDVVVGTAAANQVWYNNGTAVFTNSGQTLGDSSTSSLALGDLDNDGDVDVLSGDEDGGTVYLNQQSATNTVNAAGGTLVFGQGLTISVVVPAGLYTRTTELVYTPITPTSFVASGPLTNPFILQAFRLQAMQDELTLPNTLSQAITVTINFDAPTFSTAVTPTLYYQDIAPESRATDAWLDGATLCQPTTTYLRQPTRLSLPVCRLADFVLAVETPADPEPPLGVYLPIIRR